MENLNCPELVKDFENSRDQHIIGVKRADRAYAMKFKDGSTRMVDAQQIQDEWPQLLEDYLLERITFTMDNHASLSSVNAPIETTKVHFIHAKPPVKILGKCNLR